MHQKGISECADFSSTVCIMKVIEVVVGLILLSLVLWVLGVRLLKECRISFYLVISLFMGLTLSFSVADAFRTDLRIFPFFASFCYSVYFSVIVLKLGLKLLQVIRHQINYNSVRKYLFFGFGVYQALLLAALGYSIAKKDEDCFALPFLLANSVSLAGAIFFVLIGKRHSRQQEQRLDLTLAENKQRNPLPRFKCWVAVNFLGQVMVLIESIIFQVNNCQFTQNDSVNQICRLLFEFLSFHIGIAATIYFFHLSNLIYRNESTIRERNSTFGDTPRGIELVNLEYLQEKDDSLREKDKSRTKTTAPTEQT